jgi:hypothetical protein
MTGDEFLKQKLKWEKTPDALHPLRTQADGQELRIRIGDFPEEPMYTLLVGDQEIVQFDDWPKDWRRPSEGASSNFYAKPKASRKTK